MPSPAEVWEEATAEAAAGSPSETKGKRNGEGILGVIWRALFGGRGEDYEKRLQYLSKEEAAVHARMRRRAQFARRGVRNLVVLSILSEVGAAVYAIVMTKSEDLGWRMRAFSVLPAFSVLLKTSMSLVGVDQKDQQALERLREERKAKIDELKVRTNYLTQKLIQGWPGKKIFLTSNSGQLTSSAQDGVSATNPVAENELGNLTKRQERAEEENSVKQPMDAELQIEPLTR
uniref:Uncharacterized protein n=1 Tax=Leersia perrieri TaxID=77586 RepID=A0A0D9W7A2_9ORYZ